MIKVVHKKYKSGQCLKRGDYRSLCVCLYALAWWQEMEKQKLYLKKEWLGSVQQWFTVTTHRPAFLCRFCMCFLSMFWSKIRLIAKLNKLWKCLTLFLFPVIFWVFIQDAHSFLSRVTSISYEVMNKCMKEVWSFKRTTYLHRPSCYTNCLDINKTFYGSFALPEYDTDLCSTTITIEPKLLTERYCETHNCSIFTM